MTQVGDNGTDAETNAVVLDTANGIAYIGGGSNSPIASSPPKVNGSAEFDALITALNSSTGDQLWVWQNGTIHGDTVSG